MLINHSYPFELISNTLISATGYSLCRWRFAFAQSKASCGQASSRFLR